MSTDQLLIDAPTLAAQLPDERVRIFDTTVHLQPSDKGYRAVSGLADYESGHIPGAAFLDLIRDTSDTTSGLGFTLPAVDALSAALGALGISRESPVVLYARGHMMWATRAFWLLNYCGHSDVRVLDGGFAGWERAGLPVAQGRSSYAPTTFVPEVRADRFVQLAQMQVLVEAGNTCVVNALPDGVYTGEVSTYGRPGHIPGSLSLPYDQLLADGAFLPTPALRAALEAGQLARPERSVIYCGGGISATIPAFARLLIGLDNTAVYDGSMSEWVRAGLPLRTGTAP